jgi:hypothetical protein
MKKIVWFLSAAALLVLAGCASVELPSLGGAVSQSADTAVADFRSDEILSTTSDGAMMDGQYTLAKVMTPASNATKNESEVLFVGDGSKAWVKWIVPSRKAEKADFVVGATVLYPVGWAGYTTISAAEYRSNQWKLGRVTSTDDMFKGMVEIAGESYSVKMIRMPTIKIEE